MGKYKLINADCLEAMTRAKPESVDAIVTDPPYGLAFMGKQWDHGVPGRPFWEAALRVAKPGAHLLAFGGTRTYHRLACAIEDAGWEIRDCLMWVYGSGFPKSLDVSKAIDKAAGRIGESIIAIKREIRSRYQAQGMTLAAFNSACGFEASGYLRESSTWANVLPSADKWQTMKTVLGCGNELDQLFAAAEREVIGYQQRGLSVNTDFMSGGNNITAPATPEAQQWAGWGTALKPALEPITVARKPLVGTVAQNVLQHGTGAINVDGCRVGTEGEKPAGSGNRLGSGNAYQLKDYVSTNGGNQTPELGRWPANFIHDGSDEVVSCFPDSKSCNSPSKARPEGTILGGARSQGAIYPGETGSAARFFYCAKASKADRDAGCSGNKHPTVKPTDLMRYLCRLITPPGGVILDPFMGSGSTGKGAVLEGFRFIGIEKETEYLEIAKARIEFAVSEGKVK